MLRHSSFSQLLPAVLWAAFILCRAPLSAQQDPELEWSYLGPEEGLGMAFFDILQDHQGFMWFGSSNGLYRYDGYRIRSFKKYGNQSSRLASDWIWDLAEDSLGNIWIATYDGGLNQWERATGEIHHFQHRPGDATTLRSNNVMRMLVDPSGDLWVVVKNRDGVPVLDKFSPQTGQVTRYAHDPDDPFSLSCDTISISAFQAMGLDPIHLDAEGRVWAATKNGLNRYDRQTDRFSRFMHRPDDDQSLTFPQVIDVEDVPGAPGKYWVRTASPDLEQLALDQLDGRTNKVTRYSLGEGSAPVLGFYASPEDGTVWLSDTMLYASSSNEPSDLKVIETAVYPFSRVGFFPLSDDLFLLPPLGSNPLAAGRASDNIAYNNGILVFSTAGNELKYFSYNPTQPNQLFGVVHAVSQDHSGAFWMGMGMGIYKFKINNDHKPKFENYPLAKEGEKGLKSTRIRTVYEASSAIFWLGTNGGGLSRLNRKAGNIETFQHDPANAFSLADDQVYSLWKNDSTGQLWIGHEKGIDLLDVDAFMRGNPASTRFRRLATSDARLQDRINDIRPKNKEELWISTSINGLLLFDLDTQKVVRQITFEEHNPDPAHSRFINKVYTDSTGRTWVAPGMGGLCRLIPDGDAYQYECFLDGFFITNFLEDPDGILWLTAMNYGLVKFHPSNGNYELIMMDNGLPRNSATGIQVDSSGRIWITSLGLTCYDPQKKVFKTYGKESGILSLDPERCFYKSRSGELFYAAPEGGLQIFHPDHIFDNPNPPQVVITGFTLAGQQEQADTEPLWDGNIEVASAIHLRHDQHSFIFTFAGLEYTDPQNNQYRYQLVGHDEEVVYSGTYREARYTLVPPGRYTFKVEAANSDGVWSEEPAVMEVIIAFPLWRQWWAYGLYVVLFLSIVYALYRYQVNRKLAEQETKRLKEIDALKTRLYTNISHEFRTPLTVILGMAEQAIRTPERWSKEGMKMILRNGQNLLNLVNQMLDLRKIESGVMKVEKQQGDVINYLKYIVESFHSFAESKHIDLRFSSPLDELVMDYDEDKLLKIVTNLLSNALKYTPEGGEVVLSADQEGTDPGTLVIRVRDTGIGIAPEQRARIFDRFYQVDDSATRKGEGVGVGLALTQELVRLLEGTITVESELGKGSSFSVSLSITREAAGFHTFHKEVVLKEAGSLKTAGLVEEEEKDFLPAGQAEDEGKPLALIIEDNQDVVRYLTACLENDYQLLAAFNGRAGIETAIEHIPDVIISDVMMPEKDGFEVTATLKKDERTSHIPIILLTARATVEDRIAGLERGADAYLAKPFHREELLVRMQKLIELRARLQERYAGLPPQPATPDPALATEDEFVQKVRAAVEARLDDPDFTPTELAAAVFLSRSQLHRKLKALTGQPPGRLIRDIRLQRAHHLLTTTGKSVTQVAMEVGFRELSHFSRSFSEVYGRSPSEVRK